MAIYIGNQKIDKLYIGNEAIKEVYISDQLVYSSQTGNWQTIWEGHYNVKANSTSLQSVQFADAGEATKFRITFSWTYGISAIDRTYYRIPGQYPVDTSPNFPYTIEADVSTERNVDGYTIIQMVAIGKESADYVAKYTIEKDDNNYCKMIYFIQTTGRDPNATLTITKIEAYS